MESWGLLAVLLAIVLIGYVVVHVVFTIAGTIFEFVENNFLKVVIIALIVLALWLSQFSQH